MNNKPIIVWFRRDLRLGDHPALTKAVNQGCPVIPVFIHDEVVENHGAAPKWRLGLSVENLSREIADKGSKLILRRGNAADVLKGLAKDTNAQAVYWSMAYDPDAVKRDKAVKKSLEDMEVETKVFRGHLLFEPTSVETNTGGFYKVFTPMWKSVRNRDVADLIAAPSDIPAPDQWPVSDEIKDWSMGGDMQRGRDIVAQYVCVGESAATSRLGNFIGNWINDYQTNRDLPWQPGTSKLSENLTYGEISPRSCWHAGQRAMQEGKKGAETFLKELVWREFAYHLVHHTPRIIDDNWREDWDAFPWNEDERKAEVKAWKQGRTGIQFVDAALREMYVTGHMHNRGRMIVASYLTKHLLCHWKIGLNWFEDCLIDWDPASNAMGWQWSAGSGPDATPYFRVFNPVTQLDKFDKNREYVSTWIAEGRKNPAKQALQYFDAIPKQWKMSPEDDYPDPVVKVDEGRKAALSAYENRSF
ncbi:cryptochrome/photolyase family protein [Parasulfitobacter algicola]|uniref:Deoxyribodipyrimidine photo-lyase n=1 Tax=Parasulfitobacter algicola TaxID=2614809 RepID=A0ABX2IYS1_9RHOB|nr:deoxyribodipyrimidine photo-lyase [Sulfitobacter algicola]NSX55418.1 deoxyribodipyrimidine photo-lyase [Sulfitobacter algicola]